jgi:hypothetical protein
MVKQTNKIDGAGDFPGKEIKDRNWRDVCVELVRNQGWRYDASGSGYPRLYPPDPTQSPLSVPKTPGKDPRGFKNWVADVRRRGGIWPPERRK